MRTAVRARLSGRASQRIFDTLLRTVSEPGLIRRLPAELLQPDIPAICWLALALADVDVPVNVGDDVAHPLGALVGEATGAPVVPLEQSWLIALPEPTVQQLDRVPVGDALRPEAGARVALPVADLDRAGARATPGATALALSGPGVAGRLRLQVRGLRGGLLARLGRSSGPYPAGFDTWLFTEDGRVAALPRSTLVDVEGF